MQQGNLGQSFSQFLFLKEISPLLFDVLNLAEQYYYADPNSTLVKVRQFGENLMRQLAINSQLVIEPDWNNFEIINQVSDKLKLDQDVRSAFHRIRKLGNTGAHEVTACHKDALEALTLSYEVAKWLYRTLKKVEKNFPKYQAPEDPSLHVEALKAQVFALNEQLKTTKNNAEIYQEYKTKVEELTQANQQLLALTQSEQQRSASIIADLEQQVKLLQVKFDQNPTVVGVSGQPALVQSAKIASQSFDLTEAQTRKLIDQQLKDAGWIADTENFRYSKGTRPLLGQNMAIAEYPLELNGKKGQADYVLFHGLTPVAVVEAKRRNINPYGAIEQAEFYAQALDTKALKSLDQKTEQFGPWTINGLSYHVPFVYSCNGRETNQRLFEQTGIWFRDVRRGRNLRRALQGFHRAETLIHWMRCPEEQADEYLKNTEILPFNDRPYQRDAIKAVENNIAKGVRKHLVAMATGTGKTRLATGLMYRLITSGRFKSILFLVDRNSLAEQATEAFTTEVIRGNITLFSSFSDTKNSAELNLHDSVTIQVATVQSLVHRIFNADEYIPIDAFDCIIVDEAHRGYTLDREMTEGEEAVWDQEKYLSTYRRVLDYFDAHLVALTATPALHTVAIFDEPIFNYSYTQAVADGYLVNYDTPIVYKTALGTLGLNYTKGSSVPIYKTVTKQEELYTLPDDLSFDVADFNRSLLIDSFNEVICQQIVKDINPFSVEKTLIFCVTDTHADKVKKLLDQYYAEKYDNYDEKMVRKITGKTPAVKDVLEAYKKQDFPNIAITVDLLTTGIDVPNICNLVFLRKVRSRVLFEQMLGRGTRRADKIGKTHFRVYDAVDVFKDLDNVNSMKMISVNPNITLPELFKEFTDDTTRKVASTVIADSLNQRSQADVMLDQICQKAMRVLVKAEKYKDDPRLTNLKNSLEQVQQLWKWESKDLPKELHKMGVEQAATWLKEHGTALNGILENVREEFRLAEMQVISYEKDSIIYAGKDPSYQPLEDYLQQFQNFVHQSVNNNAAMKAVVTRPSDLTRDELKQVEATLTEAGFTRAKLSKELGHHESNHSYAAQIIALIRRAAIGEDLMPFEQRVEVGLRKILQLKDWNPEQEKWLRRLAQFIATELVVDKDSIRERFSSQGGIEMLNKVLDEDAEKISKHIVESFWKAS
ncbi:type I restriction-modification system endonuclease [Acinetobacter indicus]|uniref:type I restriction-modification system endonuclease n=1 Tax=Acinetobacter indicus TaxID=756892 RepID=UPI000CEB63CE|nr:type I restriction-modification system endonuclease [Acinetobacter indicus]AVH14341.1 type I restriction-modification system endonuclease [Acinetobacter indicus]